MADHPLQTKKLLRLPAVQSKVGLSSSRIYELISEDKFPTPIKVGPRISAWVESELDKWIDEQIAQSRASAA